MFLIHCLFLCWVTFLLYPINVFNNERYCTFYHAFCASVIITGFVFSAAKRYITFNNLRKLNHLCMLGINLRLSRWMIFLMDCWNLLSSILLRIFTSISIGDICLSSLCCIFLVWRLIHRRSLVKFPPFQLFEIVWEEIGISSSWKVW